MPRYFYETVHHLTTLHDELVADGVTSAHVDGNAEGTELWITVPAALQAQVESVVNGHDGSAARIVAAWGDVRDDRDARLRDCDWTAVTDRQLSGSALTSWELYRQALRDVPQNNSDVNDITWPISPS